ncbi:MAG: serine/threonine protein kinase [Gemmatimonadaceae bacterium]
MVGSIVADRYHILKKLGEGGMGQVYLAEHVKMGRKSALKVMHSSMVKDVDAISRFNREAANASRINHPNVAAVYDFGETPEGMIFLAMEFVDGPPLTKVIEQSGSLAPKRAAEIIRQAGEALAVAHDMGIVHRDLKPDNIMVAKTRDGGDLVKVVDFGIAKAAGNDAQKVTKTGLVVGTPEYMSPEQLAGDKLDGRSDIYSLALVAFNMLTGKLPFPSDSAQESMIMRLTDRPKALGEMRPDVSWPPDVQRVMDKALERDATQRYQTATEFGLDLYRTIDRMPATVAAELGTQMMSVPATRVDASAAAVTPRTSVGGLPPASIPVAPVATAPSGETVSVPTPAQAAAPLVTQTAAPPRRTNMIAVVVGIAAVVMAAVVVPMAMKGGGAKGNPTNPGAQPPAGAADTSKGGSPQTPINATTQPQGNANPTSGGSSPSGTGAPNGTSTTQPNGGGASPDRVKQMIALLDDSKIPAKRASVLRTLAQFERDLKSSEELYYAATLHANVLITQGDTTAACTTLKNALPSFAKTQADDANNKIQTWSCQ